jgi:hypothetical protein
MKDPQNLINYVEEALLKYIKDSKSIEHKVKVD